MQQLYQPPLCCDSSLVQAGTHLLLLPLVVIHHRVYEAMQQRGQQAPTIPLTPRQCGLSKHTAAGSIQRRPLVGWQAAKEQRQPRVGATIRRLLLLKALLKAASFEGRRGGGKVDRLAPPGCVTCKIFPSDQCRLFRPRPLPSGRPSECDCRRVALAAAAPCGAGEWYGNRTLGRQRAVAQTRVQQRRGSRAAAGFLAGLIGS